jgi:hypothetical protein
LVTEKSVGDVIRRIVVEEDHYNASYHLTDLMIDKALAHYVKY